MVISVVSTGAPLEYLGVNSARSGKTFSPRQAAYRAEKVSPLGTEPAPSEVEGALGRDDGESRYAIAPAHGARSARQDAQWPAPNWRGSGGRAWQAATETRQRGRNGQSGIGSIRLGGMPSIGVMRRAPLVGPWPSTRGVEPMRPSV